MHPLRILVVDDEPSILEVLEMYFTDDGHSVGLAKDGEEGLELFMHGEWDIVVTDRVMPRKTGDQMAQEIRKIDASMPIILVTGFANVVSASQTESPFDVIVRKPFTRDTLRGAMAKAMGRFATL